MFESRQRERPPRTAEVVVIGGGIVGCFTALELARRGSRPVVLEKGMIGDEQSSRNWGFVRQAGREEAEIPLMVRAVDLWRGLEERLETSIEWEQRGNLRLLSTQEELAWYANWAAKGNDLGVPSRMLSSGDIRALLPHAQGEWSGGMFTPNDGQADPVRATAAVAGAAQHEGARILTGTAATAILVRAGRVLGAATSSGSISTDQVVVCSGLWTRRLLRPLGLNFPIQWIRGTVAETAPVLGFPEIPAVWSRGVAFRKTRKGSLIFAEGSRANVDLMPSAMNNLRKFLPALSGNFRTIQPRLNRAALLDLRSHWFADYRYTGWVPPADRRAVRQSLKELTRLYPRIAGAPIARSWAGYIDGTPDSLPVLSLVPGISGLTVGAGFSGHGFGLSPASAIVLADLVATGKCAWHDIAPFRLSRFSATSYSPTTAIGR